MSAAVKRYRIAGCGVLAPAGIHEYVHAPDHDDVVGRLHREVAAAYRMATKKQVEIERLQGLLREVVGDLDELKPRLHDRLDAALASTNSPDVSSRLVPDQPTACVHDWYQGAGGHWYCRNCIEHQVNQPVTPSPRTVRHELQRHQND